MNKFKELKVWQTGIELALNIYTITSTFPREEIYGIISQIKRSAISIPSNIAEGAGRNSNKEFHRFLSVALGSTYELETQLVISQKLNYINKNTFDMLNTHIENIQKMIHGLQKSLLKTKD